MISLGKDVNLVLAPIAKCSHSRFNTRKTREKEAVNLLAERIKRNGFEQTRALWGIVGESPDEFEIFAGGTRLEAAKVAELTNVPVFVHTNLSDAEIARKADEDNENDEYHTPVSPLDVWAECYRLWKEEGWTQEQIANAKGWSRPLVNLRLKLHDCKPVHKAVSDGVFDEGHADAVSSVCQTSDTLGLWLTTHQAQTELTREILDKHRGSTAGIKPTVKGVRETAARWKTMIESAENAVKKLADEKWVTKFVEHLAESKARTTSAVTQALSIVTEERSHQLAEAANAANAAANAAERDKRRIAYISTQVSKLKRGDAAQLAAEIPTGTKLLLTDPPYGMNYQSQRRKTTNKKATITADEELKEAIGLLTTVLVHAHARMAEDSTCLIFTGWRYEPAFREAITLAGFEIKGSLIWVKNNHGTGDLTGSFAPRHERIIHAVKGKPKLVKRYDDVLPGKDKQNSDHPTEKPRDLLRQLIEATTEKGDIVADTFFGSGNTLIEAFALGRDFWGAEIEQVWHQVASDAVYAMAEKRIDQQK